MDELEEFPRKGRQPKAQSQSPKGPYKVNLRQQDKNPELVSRESESAGPNMMNVPDDDEVPSFGKDM